MLKGQIGTQLNEYCSDLGSTWPLFQNPDTNLLASELAPA
jgi:hypothetical protein